MTIGDSKVNLKLGWAALAGAVLVLLAGAPALAQPVRPAPVDAAAAAILKVCEGKYSTPDGGETIITVECPGSLSTCSCNGAGVNCGENSKPSPAGSTFVRGSCKQTFVTLAAAQAEVLEALYRAIFAPEE
jgi:hypothetical protein